MSQEYIEDTLPPVTEAGNSFHGEQEQQPFPVVEIEKADFDNLYDENPNSPAAQRFMSDNNLAYGDLVELHFIGSDHKRVVTTNFEDFLTRDREETEKIDLRGQSSEDLAEKAVEASVFLESEEDVGRSISAAELREIMIRHRKIEQEYAAPRTLEMTTLLSEPELDEFLEIGKREETGKTAKRLLENEAFQPQVGLHIGTESFAFSNVFKANDRQYSVAYVKDEKRKDLKPRLFYRSMSDGGWRATTGFYHDGVLSKGDFQEGDYGHYVQVTKPVEAVAAILDALTKQPIDYEASVPELRSTFVHDAHIETKQASMESQITFTRVEGKGLDAYVPGGGFINHGIDESRELLENMELPKDFEPDFEAGADRKYGIDHTILGKTRVDVFSSSYEGRPVEWHVAHDLVGHVWLERLIYKNGTATDYGTEAEVILAGSLNMKPIDYVVQQVGGEKGKDYEMFDRRYADLAKTIDRQPWVKHFRKTIEE